MSDQSVREQARAEAERITGLLIDRTARFFHEDESGDLRPPTCEILARELEPLLAAEAEARQVAEALADALKAAVKDREYQKLSGGAHFTSAPTEMEWKHESAKKAWGKVRAALALHSEAKR